MIDEIEYYKVLNYSEKEAEILYIVKDHASTILIEQNMEAYESLVE